VSQSTFVFCADLHLADGAWTSRPDIYGDAYYSLQQIIDYCVAQHLPLVIGGDVLDVKRNTAQPIRELYEAMQRMADAQLPVYYIQGQHELDRNVSWLSVHPWPQNVNQKTFEINGVKLYGIDWLPRNDIQAAFTQVPPDTAILVCHQVWKDFMKNIGRPECTLTDVHHVTRVLSGDFHVTKIEYSVNAQAQPIALISAGSTCMQDISESSEKHFYLVTTDSAGTLGFELQPLKTRPMANYVVATQAELDELCASVFGAHITRMYDPTLPVNISKPLVRVKFDKNIPDAYLRISTAIGESAHLFCDAIVDKTRGDQEINRTVTKNDLATALGELLAGHPEALNLATALVDSTASSPSMELESQFEQFKKSKELNNAIGTAGSKKLVPAQASSL